MKKYRVDLVVPEPEIVPVIEMNLSTTAWSSALFQSEAPHRWTLDVSQSIRESGNHLVTFHYRKGSSALTIHRVAVMQDGKLLTEDVHAGSTGHQNQNNTYCLNVRKIEKGKPISLVMEVEPMSSTDTAGEIDIQIAPPSTADP